MGEFVPVSVNRTERSLNSHMKHTQLQIIHRDTQTNVICSASKYLGFVTRFHFPISEGSAADLNPRAVSASLDAPLNLGLRRGDLSLSRRSLWRLLSSVM
jgi:hypothetical protein